jgi:hypothetical protein
MRISARYFSGCLIIFLMQEVCQAQAVLSEQQDRWVINPDSSIEWKVAGRLPHHDHIEMSGERVSIWVQYGVDTSRMPEISRTVVFPTFRTKPNDTHASLMYTFTDADLPRIYINAEALRADIINGRKRGNFPQQVESIRQKGIMRIESDLGAPSFLHLEHSLFPSVNKALALETFVFTNTSGRQVSVTMEYLKKEIHTDTSKSTGGPHTVIMETLQYGNRVLKPGSSVSFVVGYMASHSSSFGEIHPDQEETARKNRVESILELLRLETPDAVLNTAFAFAKIRATESIYKTKGGYMHSPGGLSYYAAIWANDQAEYINPFFAILGDATAVLSGMNAYHLFASYMNPAYKPIPSSIVAEGDSFWNGAGDRGDMAMIAYGASRFALSLGNKDSAAALWPLIEWCLEFCRRKINTDGVVESDTDELERRFPSGKANLSTSSLYYDALRSASMLVQQLGKPSSVTAGYLAQAKTMKKNIEKYFGATVEGFKTYRYYKGNEVLRSWICLPLTMQIFDRKEGTINALFSSRLWTADGLATQAGDLTFWDRSTLYALRGVLQAGEVEKAMRFLRYYSRRRLLGEHVPYPVEAFPEGNQRHLSAESGLYCRIYTEGLFGIRPLGFRSFECTPRLPQEWDKMALRNIHAFGKIFDLDVKREGKNKLTVIVNDGGKHQSYEIVEGATLTVKLL